MDFENWMDLERAVASELLRAEGVVLKYQLLLSAIEARDVRRMEQILAEDRERACA